MPSTTSFGVIHACTRSNTAECETLWRDRCPENPPPPKRFGPLEILTGGNPRLLTIIARFGAERSFRDLMENLLDLVDEHTEYFKSHLESLPPQERRVYLALARLWKPATTREVAELARLSTRNACSAQLKRLVQRGTVAIEGGHPPPPPVLPNRAPLQHLLP